MIPMLTADARSAIAHARVTGSVACTYNDTTALRLYTSTGGLTPTYRLTGWWLVICPDDTTVTIHEENL